MTNLTVNYDAEWMEWSVCMSRESWLQKGEIETEKKVNEKGAVSGLLKMWGSFLMSCIS
ncbi:MAG: hypothetical protein WCI02_04545 [Planctomycetota bacterium]|jgi:hypothetical protein